MASNLHPLFASILAGQFSLPLCATCSGTGETGSQGILDCAAPGCTAATDRHALNTAVGALGPMTLDDLVWHVFQAGKRAAIENSQGIS